MLYAHSRNESGQRHQLEDHLRSVAHLTSSFAEKLGAREAGYYLGLWHDVGKAHPDFQRYLLTSEAGKQWSGPHPDHKAAGTALAAEYVGPLAMAIQGHHGGLSSLSDVKAWLASKGDADDAVDKVRDYLPWMLPQTAISLPDHIQQDRLAAELFTRLLFSALVDADYLDTEAHFACGTPALRGAAPVLSELWDRFRRDQSRLTGQQADLVNRIRHTIYEACLDAAEGPPGLYRLTVPTGGGKTRSALGFALRHAIANGMDRVIIAIPYISITEQTVDTLRHIFECPNGPPVVLEHHSAVAFSDEESGIRRAEWSRLAAENWDCPIVVTTTVQLFDSLFSNGPRDTRKLHRVANAVIILDEAQMLPPPRLEPILDVVKRLASEYHSTIVLSTATQPGFDVIPAFRDLPAREMVPSPERYYEALQRVQYEWHLKEPWSWDGVAERMMQSRQAMVVVNTKADAVAVYHALSQRDPTALHLSAGMCGLHRSRVLDAVKRRLAQNTTCRLVATQVVEAGVDLDFALVLRAIGPLDSIIQAAGRCNREGKLEVGQVMVFQPSQGHLPPGVYRTATGLAQAVLGGGDLDPNSSGAVRSYFTQLYDTVDLDRDQVQHCRQRLDYPETAKRFRMIDDDTVPIVVPFGDAGQQARLQDLLDRLEGGLGSPRMLYRGLQPYIVNVPRHRADRARARGHILEPMTDLYLWAGSYDADCGLLFEDGPSEALIL